MICVIRGSEKKRENGTPNLRLAHISRVIFFQCEWFENIVPRMLNKLLFRINFNFFCLRVTLELHATLMYREKEKTKEFSKKVDCQVLVMMLLD